MTGMESLPTKDLRLSSFTPQELPSLKEVGAAKEQQKPVQETSQLGLRWLHYPEQSWREAGLWRLSRNIPVRSKA